MLPQVDNFILDEYLHTVNRIINILS